MEPPVGYRGNLLYAAPGGQEVSSVRRKWITTMVEQQNLSMKATVGHILSKTTGTIDMWKDDAGQTERRLSQDERVRVADAVAQESMFLRHVPLLSPMMVLSCNRR